MSSVKDDCVPPRAHRAKAGEFGWNNCGRSYRCPTGSKHC